MRADLLTAHKMIVGMRRLILVRFLCFLEKLFALRLDVVQAFNCALLIAFSMQCGGKKPFPCSVLTSISI